MLVSKGKKWQRDRSLLTPAFHYEILKAYVPVVNSCLDIFLKKWTASFSGGISVCVFRDVGKLSLDIITRCAFSTETGCQASDTHSYINAILDINRLVTDRFLKIWCKSDFIYYLTAEGERFKQSCLVAHNFTESVIRKRKKALEIEENGVKSDREVILDRASRHRKYLDFLDILLMVREEMKQTLSCLGAMTPQPVAYPGPSTAWPNIQNTRTRSVKNVLMGRECLEYDDLKELKYTQWCIQEAMRLYPPVPQILRTTTTDTEIEGCIFPKGTMVNIAIFQIHRHPDIWENPNEYNPLNFHPSKAEGWDLYAYMPFSAGYRNCIGQNFALNEMKMVIASIIYRFQISLDDSHEVEVLPTTVSRSKNDIKMKLNLVKEL